MPVKIATGKDLKRVKVFLGNDGQKYEGTIENFRTNPKVVGHDVGRATSTDRLSEGSGEIEEGKKE